MMWQKDSAVGDNIVAGKRAFLALTPQRTIMRREAV